MTIFASAAVKSRMLKLKFGELLGRIGSLDDAVPFCRVGKSTLARYASTGGADAEFFAPIDVVRDLETLAGAPIVTSILCEAADGVFVPVPSVAASGGDLLAMMSTLSGEFNDTTRAICSSPAPGPNPLSEGQTMKRLPTAALCAASMMLASCATMPPPTPGQAAQIGTAIDRAQAAYDRIASTAELVLPFLSPERAARVHLAMSLAERGLLAARYAATAVEQSAALKQFETATAATETATSK